MELGVLHFAHGLLTEHTVEFAIEGGDLVERVDVACIEKLTDARGVIHRLVLQG